MNTERVRRKLEHMGTENTRIGHLISALEAKVEEGNAELKEMKELEKQLRIMVACINSIKKSMRVDDSSEQEADGTDVEN